MNKLWNKTNYLKREYKYLKKTLIQEYDIKSAGLNVLYNNNLISKEFYKYLSLLEKNDRNITIGNLLIKHPEWNKLMIDELKLVIKEFMEINNINDEDILSINKDSIVLINKMPKKLNLDGYIFKKKGNYNNFLLLGQKYEFYINSNELNYEIKGFGEDVLKNLEDTFFNFIFQCIMIDNSGDKFELFNFIKEFRTKYVNYELNEEYYFDIDEEGYVLVKNDVKFTLKNLPENFNIKEIIITGNYRYLIKLIEIFLLKNG